MEMAQPVAHYYLFMEDDFRYHVSPHMSDFGYAQSFSVCLG